MIITDQELLALMNVIARQQLAILQLEAQLRARDNEDDG